MADVVQFDGSTKLPLPVDRVLTAESALALKDNAHHASSHPVGYSTGGYERWAAGDMRLEL